MRNRAGLWHAKKGAETVSGRALKQHSLHLWLLYLLNLPSVISHRFSPFYRALKFSKLLILLGLFDRL